MYLDNDVNNQLSLESINIEGEDFCREADVLFMQFLNGMISVITKKLTIKVQNGHTMYKKLL